jgi:hypothetical protein
MMSDIRSLDSLALRLVILVLMLFGPATVSAAPKIKATLPATFQFPIPGAVEQRFSFLVFSEDIIVTSLTAKVREIRGPAEQVIDNDAVHSIVLPASVTKQGEPVEIVLKPHAFAQVGSYRVTLLLSAGDTSSASKDTISVVLNFKRASALLNVDKLKDRVFELTRSCLSGTASDTIELPLSEISGKADVVNPVVSWDPILASGIYVPGTLAPIINERVIPAGGTVMLRIALSDVARAGDGDYSTEIHIVSPSLDSQQNIPIKLRVADYWFLPFCAILLGVIGGTVVHGLAGSWRVKQINQYTILRIQRDIEIYRGVVRNMAKMQALSDIDDSLQSAITQNQLGNYNAAREKLEATENLLQEFRKAEIGQRGTLFERLNQLTRRFGTAGGNLDPLTDPILVKIKVGLTEIPQLLGSNKVDEATSKIEALEDDMSNYESAHKLEEAQQNADDKQKAGDKKKEPEQTVEALTALLWKTVKRLQRGRLALTVIAMILATLTGFLFYYSGKPFGTFEDYCRSFLWGFGVNTTLQGFAAILGAITTQSDSV